MLHIIGVASDVKYDRFCYIDYRDVTHCVLWLLIMVPCVFGVLFLYVHIYKRGGLSKTVCFGWFVFLCSWVLGIPLIGFGLSNREYPDNLNVISAILGHLMNLNNPVLYGIFWYKWFVANRRFAPQKELDTEFEVQDASASSVPYALPAPWNTPVLCSTQHTMAPHLFTHVMRLLPTPAYTQEYRADAQTAFCQQLILSFLNATTKVSIPHLRCLCMAVWSAQVGPNVSSNPWRRLHALFLHLAQR